MTEVQEFLSSVRSGPFRRGRHDCVSLVIRWAEHVMGKSASGSLTDPNLTAGKVRRHARAAGGIRQLAVDHLTSHGWGQSRDGVRDGDILIGWHQSAFDGVFVGLASAGFAVSVGYERSISKAGLFIVDPNEIGSLEAWRYNRKGEHGNR